MKQSKLFENTSHYKTMRERAFESDLRKIADELESYTKEKEPRYAEEVAE
ncbi:hypothetical protein FUSO7_12360 [Fusobacterium necrophorum BFTR-2]|nr:hypothetical protein [Fusobacterium necrophorum]KDE68983.1 hypothetical protein FUSO7_12360 [Fusobacterium necrophorum BFTR-2]